MTSRLVLGCGSLGLTLVETLAERRGSLTVMTADEHRIRTLRSDGIDVVARDAATAGALSRIESTPDTVVVAGDGAATNRAVAERARDRFADAFVLAYAGENPTGEQRGAIADAADEVIDGTRSAADAFLENTGDGGIRVRQLRRVLRGIDGELAIVAHDNPDPDAIASAVALANIAESTGLTATIYYYGSISHQENRAFVNLLEYDLRELDDGDVPEPMDGVALVDHSRPGVNDGLPADTTVDVVIDHHPPRVPADARFVDLRSDVGATSTLLVEYLTALEFELTTAVATGLLFGIRVDTDDFRREVSPTDFEAAATLLPHADMTALKRIESPTVSTGTLEILGRAIENRVQDGSVLLSGVGQVTDHDALAQAADQLLNLEGVSATLVYGIVDGSIHGSARARGTDLDLGEVLRDAFGQIGSAGGHADMAGAQVELGVLERVEDRDEDLRSIVDSIVTNRFFEALESHDSRLLGDVYGPTPYDLVENGPAETTSDDAIDDRDAATPVDDLDEDGSDTDGSDTDESDTDESDTDESEDEPSDDDSVSGPSEGGTH